MDRLVGLNMNPDSYPTLIWTVNSEKEWRHFIEEINGDASITHDHAEHLVTYTRPTGDRGWELIYRPLS